MTVLRVLWETHVIMAAMKNTYCGVRERITALPHCGSVHGCIILGVFYQLLATFELSNNLRINKKMRDL